MRRTLLMLLLLSGSAPVLACGFHDPSMGHFGSAMGGLYQPLHPGTDEAPPPPPSKAELMEKQRALFLARYPSLRQPPADAPAQANTSASAQ